MFGFKYYFIGLLLLVRIIYTQDCDEDEIELWNDCYSIENTDSLNLSGLYIDGEIPLEIGSLINLSYLNLSINELSGPIPDEIGDLSNLNYLYLQSNELSGTIPPTFGNLINLISLKLYGNNLTGEIPNEFSNMVSLEYLSMSSNELSGSIPSIFSDMDNLEKLYLFDNNLSGPIPANIGQLSNLSHLYLNGNNLSSYMPSIKNLTNLTRIYIYDNQLTGELPCDMCELEIEWENPSLVKIYDNQFCPPYPECIQGNIGVQDTSNCDTISPRQFNLWDKCYMVETTDSINLGNTGLSGPIPPEIGNLINLKYLFLFENSLNGDIPPSIGNLENLTHLYLYKNDLTGSLPSELGDLTSLTHMLLYSNSLSGEIPDEISDLIELQQLFLYNNQLTGGLPLELDNLINLQYLYLNDNQLSGHLDNDICLFDFEWDSSINFNIFNNSLCPPYPVCIEDYIGYQDTMACDEVRIIQKEIASQFIVFNSYPNPFNSSVKIHYSLPKDEMVKIFVHDLSSRKVCDIYLGLNTAGYNAINWNAKNSQGIPVGTGIYFVTIEAGKFNETKKIIFVE